MSASRSPWPHLTDLLSASLGGRALACSDDFFASMDNLVKDEEPHFDPDTYYERGKVMDGWESRRKRGPGHDWCILSLGVPGVIRGLDLDTRHFTGNHAPWAAMEALHAEGDPSVEDLQGRVWTPILPQVALALGSHNLVPVHDDRAWTHLRLNIFPDGGVARLRVYGEVARELDPFVEHDLAALENGGKALACSDMYFGVMDHLIAPGQASDMRGGWETRRRRGEGEDWVLLRLAARGTLNRIVLDTRHFKGNFPDMARVEGIDWEGGPPHSLLRSDRWTSVVPWIKLQAHHEHVIDLDAAGPLTHLRLRITPCGGVSRLRAFGNVLQGEVDPVLEAWKADSDEAFVEHALQVCGSQRWARAMAAGRPFAHRGELLTHAERVWWTLTPADWQEAFAHHPRIGEDPERLRRRFAHTAEQSSREQAGIASATAEILDALTRENEAYEERFGHVFLVRAAGRSAPEMLQILRERMKNTPERELREAAHAQSQITALRILAGGTP